MNKKEYMMPDMRVVVIKTMGMLASSPVGSRISTTEATGDALSRGIDVWDDEE